MYLLHLFLLASAISATHRRKNVALVSRHRQSQKSSSEVVPSPNATLPNLNNLETTIRKWPEGGIGGTIESTGEGGSAVSELNANLRELSNWSNDGMAKLMGASGSQEVSISVLRSQFDQFRNETRRSLSRITDALQSIGADTAEGSTQSANGIQSRLKTMQSQLDALSSNSKSVSSFNSQLTTAQEAIVRMNERVVAIEDFTGITAAAAAGGVQSAESSSYDAAYLSFDFLIKSWTGRFAILGVALGLIGLILGIVALVTIPKKPAVPKGDEQVLLEAGGEDPNAQEGVAENAEGYDPNAEQYYYQEGEEQQQEEVPAT